MTFKSLLVIPAAMALSGCASKSARSGSSVTAKVTGFFEVDGSRTLNLPAILTGDDQTWLQYGVFGAPELSVLFTNSTTMAGHGVTIGSGRIP